MNPSVLARGLWNRTGLRIQSDEQLAQILDRGGITAWRELYRLGRTDPDLRARIKRLVVSVPVPLPHFWLAALASLGEEVDFSVTLPDYYTRTSL